MFAPNYHPAMRHAMPVRRELGVRTVFNLLGPLTNPAGAKRQLLGVAHPNLCETMSQALSLLGAEHSMVVHGEDGLDELSLGGMTHVWETEGGVTQKYVLWPEDGGMLPCSLDEIKGGTPDESAQMMRGDASGRARSAAGPGHIQQRRRNAGGRTGARLHRGARPGPGVHRQRSGPADVDSLVALSRSLD